MFVDFRVFIWVYMIKKLIGVKFDDMVKRVGEVMVEFDIGFFVVVDENGDVVGFLIKGDIIRWMVIFGLLNIIFVKEIMMKDFVIVFLMVLLGEVFDLFLKKGIKYVFVEEEGKIVGIFLISDFFEVSRRRFEMVIVVE